MPVEIKQKLKLKKLACYQQLKDHWCESEINGNWYYMVSYISGVLKVEKNNELRKGLNVLYEHARKRSAGLKVSTVLDF